MAKAKKAAEGRVNVLKTRSTEEVARALGKAEHDAEKYKYKPAVDQNAPGQKGRDPVATKTTSAVNEQNEKNAADVKKLKYQDPDDSPYKGVAVRRDQHPARTTRQVAETLEDKETKEKKAEEEAKKKGQAG